MAAPARRRFRFRTLRGRFLVLLGLLAIVSLIPWVVARHASSEVDGLGATLDLAGSLRHRTMAIEQQVAEAEQGWPIDGTALEQLIDEHQATLDSLTDGDPARRIPACTPSDAHCARLRAHQQRWARELAPATLAVASSPATAADLRGRLQEEFSRIDATVHAIADHAEVHVDEVRWSGMLAAIGSLVLLALVGIGVWMVVARIGRLQRAAAATDAEAQVAALVGGARGDELGELARALAESLREERVRGEQLAANLELVRAQQRAMDRLAADAELATTLVASGEVDEALGRLGARLRAVIPHEHAALWLLEGADVGERAWRITGTGAVQVAAPAHGPVPQRAAVVPGGEGGPCQQLLGADDSSALIVPLHGASGPLGCLVLGRSERPFTDEDLGTTPGVAAILTSAIERMRLGEQLRLAQQVALVGGFGRMLAHELRNPLNSLALHMELLERALAAGGRGDKVIARRLEALRTESARLVDLVQHYQAMSATVGPVGFRSSDLRGLTREAVASERPLLDPLDAHVDVDPGEEPVMVDVDSARIVLLLRNLIAYAAGAMNGADERRLAVKVRRQGPRASVTVSYHGPELADPARVFLPDPDQPATDGMGLPVCLQIARLHGGSLLASNQAGGDIELLLSLPLRRAGEISPIRQ